MGSPIRQVLWMGSNAALKLVHNADKCTGCVVSKLSKILLMLYSISHLFSTWKGVAQCGITVYDIAKVDGIDLPWASMTTQALAGRIRMSQGAAR